MKYDFLTHCDLVKLLDLIHSLTCIKDMDQIQQVAYSFKEVIECDQIIFGIFEKHSNKEVININYPQEWINLYQANGFDRIDPVVLAIMENSTPQHWTDIYNRFPPDKFFLSLAHDFDLKDGCACHVQRGICHPGMAISASGNFKKNISKVKYIFEMISPHFYIALSSLKKDLETKKLQNLTKRECEVLRWLSQGKTSWEISTILSVAEVTVNFHVNNIKAKLNVSGRSHAVAVAIHGGLAI